MPIEIRELVIKTTIVENDSIHQQQDKSNLLTKKESERISSAIYQQCIEKIEAYFNQRKER